SAITSASSPVHKAFVGERTVIQARGSFVLNTAPKTRHIISPKDLVGHARLIAIDGAMAESHCAVVADGSAGARQIQIVGRSGPACMISSPSLLPGGLLHSARGSSPGWSGRRVPLFPFVNSTSPS